jgi:hypothetical protein
MGHYRHVYYSICDGTDISEDINLDVQVHIQSIVPTLEQFQCYV